MRTHVGDCGEYVGVVGVVAIAGVVDVVGESAEAMRSKELPDKSRGSKEEGMKKKESE